MRYQYRVTKYNPAFRNAEGVFQKSDWTSRSDIGRFFDGVQLTEAEYNRTEAAYLFAVETLLYGSGIKTLSLRSLENHGNNTLPVFVKPNKNLTFAQCIEFSRIALRELAWGQLISPGRAYIHFGYDYYLYVGLPKRCKAAISSIQERGLFVEQFRSPYLRARPNNAFKRTAIGSRVT